MIKILLFLIYLIILTNFNHIHANFESLSPIKAQDLNNKFNEIKNYLLHNKNTSIEFNQFAQGEIISKVLINQEIQKLLNLNINPPLLESSYIKSSEFNSVFSIINTLLAEANFIPIISMNDIQTNINTPYSGQIIIQDDEPVNFIIINPPQNGKLVLQNNGQFTYIPDLNFYGDDSFSVIANDGKDNSNELSVNITIQGVGIILANGVRTYFDGTPASSCREYRFQNLNNLTYTGSTGNGIYLIKPNANPAFSAYCDMTTDGGGWTQVMRQHNNTMELHTTGSLRLANLPTRNHNAKLADTLIRTLANSGQREALIEYNTNNKYIIRYSQAEWNNYSSTGNTNVAYDTKASNGVWTANRCNGHYNNRGFSTYSDAASGRCPGIFQGSLFYFSGYHPSGWHNISSKSVTNILVR